MMQVALRLARKGELREAMGVARRVIGAEPRREEAYLLIGSSCEQLGDVDCASEIYEEGIEALPRSADLLRERGLLRLQSGAVEAAVADLERALELAPSAETQIDLAFAYLFAEAPDQALARSAQSVESDPECFLCWMGRGEILSRLDRGADAVQAYRSAVALDQSDPGARAGLARALFQAEAHDEAHALFEALVESDPEDGRLRVQAAQAAMAAGAPDRAVAHLEYLAQANPEDAALFRYLLQAQEAAGDVEGAARTQARLEALTPN